MAARSTLNKEQTQRLHQLLHKPYTIASKDGSVQFTATSFDIIHRLRDSLKRRNIHVYQQGARLVGSGAASVLEEKQPDMHDIDFSFYVYSGNRFLEILQIEEEVICSLLSKHGHHYTQWEVYNRFFLDSVKVENDFERWSLITIGTPGGTTIDIKFVHKTKRCWAFSTDSFEIALDSLFSKHSESEVPVESLYGDYREALKHLHENRLTTVRPQDIRRGIFRYCHELAKGRKPEEDQSFYDKIFVEALFAEDLQFSEVLSKFLQKRTKLVYILEFLKQLKDTITRHCSKHKEWSTKATKYCNIIAQFMEDPPKHWTPQTQTLTLLPKPL